MGKKWGVGNINQSVHLVGSHMADQHANSANLLIFSNGVQLIPLAAFISPSHAEGREVEKKGREQRRVCYDSLLFLLNSFFPPQSLSKQRNQTLVMNEVDTRASGSSCGNGGGGATRGESRKSEKLGSGEETMVVRD